MALGGRRFVNRHNNQPKIGGSVRGDDRGEAGGGGERGGYAVQSFGAVNRTMKKNIVAFGGLQAMIFNTTTNQKQASATEGTMEGRRDKQEG